MSKEEIVALLSALDIAFYRKDDTEPFLFANDYKMVALVVDEDGKVGVGIDQGTRPHRRPENAQLAAKYALQHGTERINTLKVDTLGCQDCLRVLGGTMYAPRLEIPRNIEA